MGVFVSNLVYFVILIVVKKYFLGLSCKNRTFCDLTGFFKKIVKFFAK